MARKKNRRKARKAKRRSYVTNPRRRSSTKKVSRRRKYRRNPGSPIVEVVKDVGIGVASALAVSKVSSMIPIKNDKMKNAVLAGAGVLLAIAGRKNNALKFVGLGSAILFGTRAAVSFVPKLAGDDELTPAEQMAILEYAAQMNGEYDEYEDADILEGVLDGDEDDFEDFILDGVLDGDDFDDYDDDFAMAGVLDGMAVE